MNAVRRAVKVGAAALPHRRGVSVLLYHRVGARTPTEVDLPTALFTEQMLRVAARARPLDDALDALRDCDVGSHDIVVTFDDGTADFAEVALPRCVDAGVPVTLYVATEFIEAQREFPDMGRPLTWAALRDCLATGLLTIGSHTHRHALMDRVGPADAAQEIDRSIALIEDNLGVTPAHFAYPKAVLGTAAVEIEVRRRFRSAAVAGTRPNRPLHTDAYRLQRSPIQVGDGLRYFNAKADGGMWFEDSLRRRVNHVRYRRITT